MATEDTRKSIICGQRAIRLHPISVILCFQLRVTEDLMRRLNGLKPSRDFNLSARIAVRMVLFGCLG